MKNENIISSNRINYIYPVICNVTGKVAGQIRQNVDFVLDQWILFENTDKNPFPDCVIPAAIASRRVNGEGPYRTSPSLTLRQLFSAWRAGGLIHPAFYDRKGNVIHKDMYQVGIIYRSPDYYLVWGIIPSRKTTLIAELPGVMEIAGISAYTEIYFQLGKKIKKALQTGRYN